ncbi:MAG: helicase-exonuclease AddAB subunit AddA [Ruminococcus sp.]|nr:helicase-exonuclease AddAB subunit AddA [Ruminococcus sp.]
MKWTDQQETAIKARNASFIVSAAAGSGKTAVLTERLVKLLSDEKAGIRADRIVAVTFTNAAASELKKKLDRRFRQLINDHPDEPYLLKQQVLLQSAKIATINSFCFELLRDNITEQGITSGFGVLDENDVNVIHSQAINELFDEYSHENYDKISYLYDKFCINDQKPLIDAVFSVDRFLSSVAIGEKWLDIAIKEYKKDFADSIYFRTFFNNVSEKLHKALELAEKNLKSVPDIIPDMTNPQAVKSLEQAQEDFVKVQTLVDMADKNLFPDDETAAQSQNFARLVSLGKKTEYNEALRDIYKERREQIKKILKEIIPCFAAAPRDFEESGKVAELLGEIVKRFRNIVWEKKCERNSISFDDGERLVLELLMEYDVNGRIIQSEIAKRIAEYYDIILVDEYQDSNNKQDLIFKLISKGYKHDSAGKPMYGRNAFVVGDVKQSIYRFRLANPKNFIDVMKSSDKYSEESESENKAILLNKNFRSSPQVIDFVNFIFGELMTKKCGEITYTDDEKLYFGAEQYDNGEDDSRITQINFIDGDMENEDDVRPEAEVTADLIADMIKKGIKVTQNDGTSRICQPKDFCILVRTNPAANIYAEALEKRGIAAKGSDEKGYLKSREISVLTDLLRVIANPMKDIPLAAVMVSPMYPFEIRDIAVLRTFDKKLPLFSLVRLAADNPDNQIDSNLSARCKDFLQSIDSFRLNSVTMTIGVLISSIYDTTDFVSVMQQYTDGDKKRANLRLLIQYAKNYEAASAAEGGGGLSGFVAHLDRVLESGDYEQGKVSSASGDYVTVQTMHKSKGLEYPFVFVAELGYKFRFDSDKVMCSDDGRMGFILCDKNNLRRYRTFQQLMLNAEGQRDTRSEELRLLYVALTRAKQQLFINLCCGDNERKKVATLVMECVIGGSDTSEQAEQAKTYADWFWLALMKHGDFIEIADRLEIEGTEMGYPAFAQQNKLFNYNIIDSYRIHDIKAEKKQSAQADEKIVNQLTEMFESTYDRTLANTPAKLSVTQLSKKFTDDEEFDLRLKRPSFLQNKRYLSGAERGTAIHSFFQYCSFENAITDTRSEINRLADKGYLIRSQAESINMRKVQAFFRTDLYKRMCSSDSVEREKKFTVAAAELNLSDSVFDKLKQSDGMIKGIIDLMFEETDGIVIVDYKSDRFITEEQLKQRYFRQLEIYKAAIELTTGKKVKELLLYSIELEKEIII